MKIVKVKWLDARSVDGWCELKDFDEELSLIYTAGYLIKENKDALYVSACVAFDEKGGEHVFSCTIVIPKDMIRYIENINDESSST